MAIDDEPGADQAEHADPRWRLTPTKVVATVILVVAIVVPLLTWTYARVTPKLFGFPFFYWYQLLWVFLAAGACYLAYALLRREAREFRAGQHTTLTPPTGPPPGDAGSDQLAGAAPDAAPDDVPDDVPDDATDEKRKAE